MDLPLEKFLVASLVSGNDYKKKRASLKSKSWFHTFLVSVVGFFGIQFNCHLVAFWHYVFP